LTQIEEKKVSEIRYLQKNVPIFVKSGNFCVFRPIFVTFEVFPKNRILRKLLELLKKSLIFFFTIFEEFGTPLALYKGIMQTTTNIINKIGTGTSCIKFFDKADTELNTLQS
jgi:hypothetical protein